MYMRIDQSLFTLLKLVQRHFHGIKVVVPSIYARLVIHALHPRAIVNPQWSQRPCTNLPILPFMPTLQDRRVQGFRLYAVLHPINHNSQTVCVKGLSIRLQ